MAETKAKISKKNFLAGAADLAEDFQNAEVKRGGGGLPPVGNYVVRLKNAEPREFEYKKGKHAGTWRGVLCTYEILASPENESLEGTSFKDSIVFVESIKGIQGIVKGRLAALYGNNRDMPGDPFTAMWNLQQVAKDEPDFNAVVSENGEYTNFYVNEEVEYENNEEDDDDEDDDFEDEEDDNDGDDD